MGFGSGSSGSSIAGASDAALSNPTENEVLTYNDSTDKWVNRTGTASPLIWWNGTSWLYPGPNGSPITSRPNASSGWYFQYIDTIGNATIPAWFIIGDIFFRPDYAGQSSAPQFIGATYNATNANVTSLSVDIPTSTQNGDLIILVSVGLSSTVTHNIATGPALISLDNHSRTGIATYVWSKTAVTADAGATINVAYSAALPVHLGVIVLRGVQVITSHAWADQGSGSSIVTVPTFAPAVATLPLHVVTLARSSAAAASLTPATGITIFSENLPTASPPRTGIAFGWNAASETAVGTTWTNISDHFAITARLTLTVEE